MAFFTNGQLLARERWKGVREGKYCIDYGLIIETWDLSTSKLHPDIVKGRYGDTDEIVTNLPLVNDVEFLNLQNRYVKARNITIFQGRWVCFQDRKILWLPLKYRPTCYAASDNIVALGHGQGEVTYLKLSF